MDMPIRDAARGTWLTGNTDAAARLFGCAAQDVRIEVGVDEVDGKLFHFAEAWTSRRQGRVARGQRDAERIARVPFVGGLVGEQMAHDALAELLTAELAAQGAA